MPPLTNGPHAGDQLTVRDPSTHPQRGDILDKPFESRRIVLGADFNRVYFAPHMNARSSSCLRSNWKLWAKDANVVRLGGLCK